MNTLSSLTRTRGSRALRAWTGGSIGLVRTSCSALALLVLASCFSTSTSAPERRYFALDPSSTAAPQSSAVESEPPSHAVLGVRRVRVAPRYEGRDLVYRTGDLEYESDYYHQFLIGPSAMLTAEVRRALERSGGFEHVVDATSRVEPDLMLESVVDELYGDFRGSHSPSAVLEMQFFVLEGATPSPAILAEHRYQRAIPLKERSASALVAGWNQALGEILAELGRDLARLDRAPAGP